MTTLPGFSGRLVAQSFVASLGRQDPAAAAIAGQHSWKQAHGFALDRLGPASTPRAIFESAVTPLLTVLGFERLDDLEQSDRSLLATARSAAGVVAVVVTAWAERLDGAWGIGVQAAARRGAVWCLCCNGREVRVIDAGRLYSRRFAAFDLSAVADHPATAAVLWRLASATALSGRPQDEGSLHAIVAASDRFSAGVSRSLREGVLAASEAVLSGLLAADRHCAREFLDRAFEQALTIVYRILFLLFAEARALVPIWHPVYRQSYSIESLRDAAERSDRAAGLWDALRAIARLAHSGCQAGDLHVSPFNGRLFSPARTPLAERRSLDNRAARRAVLALSTRPTSDRAARERIVYRDLGVEELGAVYETLLDYRPRVDPGGGRRREPRRVSLEPGAGIRKATGTFYTPQAIADYLVRRTLAPLVRDSSPEDILRLRVLDMSMGSGAFLVAACRYLATAYEQASLAAGQLHAADVDDATRALLRRLVAERCLYGVDVNPMAVQLARLSLWLATLASGRPLSFLDHRLIAGDSLLGAWLTNLRDPPRLRKRSAAELPLFDEDAAAGALKEALPIRFALTSMPGDTVEQVRAKERAFAGLAADRQLSVWKRIANLWCSSWFTDQPGAAPRHAFRAIADDLLSGCRTLPAGSVERYVLLSEQAARSHRFLHWELEFPEAFFEEGGQRLTRPGFDAIIGNPPWDMLRADQATPESREDVRRTVASTIRFTRDSGVYRAQSVGHPNRYQLFVERTLDLTRQNGRFGLVLPSGLATDHGSAALRRLLFSRADVDGLVGFDNSRRIFPIHRSVRFLLVSATVGAPTARVGCCFGLDSLSALETPGDDGDRPACPVQVSRPALERLSGDALAIPHLRSALDLAIAERATVLFRPLGSNQGWAARFGRELNATDDRAAFGNDPRDVPIVDGRHITPFHVNTAGAVRRIGLPALSRRLDAARIRKPRLAYRDVASTTNRLTLLAGILPAGCVSTHTVFCLRTRHCLADLHLLSGFFNSLVVNYLVRLWVTTHVTTAIVERLPIPTRGQAPEACRTISAIARRLSRRHAVDDWALLNARIAALYQLTSGEFAYVLGTFPLLPRHERDAALAVFRGL